MYEYRLTRKNKQREVEYYMEFVYNRKESRLELDYWEVFYNDKIRLKSKLNSRNRIRIEKLLEYELEQIYNKRSSDFQEDARESCYEYE